MMKMLQVDGRIASLLAVWLMVCAAMQLHGPAVRALSDSRIGLVCIEDDFVTIRTTGGDVRGTVEAGFWAFRGIPYAEPPVADLRFLPPVPRKPWAPQVLDAAQFGPVCPQSGNYSTSGPPPRQDEDCLYLNVYVPAGAANSSHPVPVMVFIYGGGWVQGMGSDPLYWGDYLANTSDVLLVTLNYRLGALGFLVTPDSPGNMGLHDQRLALQWVHDNIAAFGGDVQRITLFGQSAGAISVGAHLTSPQTAPGAFHRAVVQSNPFSTRWRTLDEMRICTQLFAALLGCTDTTRVDRWPPDMRCLRAAPWPGLLRAQADCVCVPDGPLRDLVALTFQPTLDGWLLVDQALDRLAAGTFLRVPVLLGTVTNETTSFVYGAVHAPLPPVEYGAALAALFGARDAPAVLQQYPAAADDARPTLAQLLTDFLFVCPTRQAARFLAAAAAPPSAVYLYSFAHWPALDPINDSPECRGRAACHGAELAYVFHSAALTGHPFQPAEGTLSTAVMQAWTEFAATGAVTGWQPVVPDAQTPVASMPTGVMVLDEPAPRYDPAGFRSQYCDFWDNLMGLA